MSGVFPPAMINNYRRNKKLSAEIARQQRKFRLQEIFRVSDRRCWVGLKPSHRRQHDERAFERSAHCGATCDARFWRNDCARGKRRGVLPQGCHWAYDELQL
jgi:hypothetical protein